MNRETKRMLKRQGQVDDAGNPVAAQRPTPAQRNVAATSGKRRRSPFRWLKEVRAELRKVAWPTREEVQRYSTVVFITLLMLIALIFCLDFVFSKAAVFLFK